MTRIVVALLAATVLASPAIAVEQAPRIKVMKHFVCSGKLATYSVSIADRSIGGGDEMCYFVSRSDVGRAILKRCRIGQHCRVVGTVHNNTDEGDWSPIIVELDR
ncbi:MAG: hypothetical protein C0480_02865 [Bradyrhizobium sp.]|nr:hypothetical protein [Bradyrhizobium sp.]